MKDKIINFIKHFLYIGLLIFTLVYITIGLAVLFSFGSTLLLDIFGNGLLYFFYTTAILIGIFSLFLKYKRKLSFSKTTLYSVIVILIYLFAVTGAHKIAEHNFKTFTIEKWTAYPHQRYHMLNNLTMDLDFRGMKYEDVITVLGEPDYNSLKDSNGKIEYIIKNLFLDSQYIRFTIENGIVTDAHIFNDELKDFITPLYSGLPKESI